MRSTLVMAGALCVLQGGVAHAQSALQLAPTEEWELGSASESCWISRRFGDPDKGVFVRIEAFGTGSGYRVFLRGKPLPQRDSGILEFQTQFFPNGTTNEQRGILNWSGNVPTLTFATTLKESVSTDETGDLPKSTYSGIDAATNEVVLTFTFSRGAPVSLQLGSMEAPLARLQECAGNLPAQWGFDVDQQRSLARRPIPIDGDHWVDPGSFPWEYLRNYQSVVVYLRFMVDEQGMPTACVVQAPQYERAASDIACRTLMANARFEPALDVEGRPSPSYFTTSIFYMAKRRNGN